VRQPCGIVLAITPFNYPALLALHKVAPALAAGNSVVLKPAESTPLAALAVAACFVDAGLPAGVLSVVTGHGDEIGDVLVADRRIRKISFTGSTDVGERISRHAGVKKLSLELGASCPVVILPDADLEQAASAVAAGGYANAGQVCTSVQRVVSHPAVLGDFLDALVPKVQAIQTGDPALPDTAMGTLISTAEAKRVQHAIARPLLAVHVCSPGASGTAASWRPPWLSVSTRRRRSARTSCSARRARAALQPTGRALSRRSTARDTACQPESSPPTSSARSARFER
jgi:NAD-dependent aldehyde dehydrogenases